MSDDPEFIPLPPRVVLDGFGNPVMQQRWWFVPGTLDFMEEQFRDCITPEPEEESA